MAWRLAGNKVKIETKRITGALLAELDRKAQASSRLRTNHNLHEGPQAAVQRLAIKLRRGTYICPHRHPQRWELGLVLQGRMVCCTATSACPTRRRSSR